jgi:serine/threonine protein kinase
MSTCRQLYKISKIDKPHPSGLLVNLKLILRDDLVNACLHQLVQTCCIGPIEFDATHAYVTLPNLTIYQGKVESRLAAIKIVVMVPEELEEILLEASILRACTHANVVAFLGMYTADNHLWICMELCGAGAMDLVYRFTKSTLSEEQIAYVLHDTLKGLAYLHEEVGIIHRDIKSGNIMVTDEGEIKLGNAHLIEFTFAVSLKIMLQFLYD